MMVSLRDKIGPAAHQAAGAPMQDSSSLSTWWSRLEWTPEPRDDLQQRCVRGSLGRIADAPNHFLHLGSSRFMGPHSRNNHIEG